MNRLSNLRIGQRLGLGFALLIATVIAIAFSARAGLASVKHEFDLLTGDRQVKVDRVTELKRNVLVIGRMVRDTVILEDPEQDNKRKAAIEETRKANAELIATLDKSITSTRGHQLLEDAAKARAVYNTAIDKVVAMGVANRATEAAALLADELTPAGDDYNARLDALIAYQRELMKASADSVAATVANVGWLLLGAAALAAAVGAFIAWAITRSITRPIARAVEVAETVAAGDLSARVTVQGRDETAQLLGALQRMSESLARTVALVRGNAESVASASSQIAQGNADLSQRTEEQSSNLQQTAASMEQLTSTVRQNADTARTASQLAGSASGVAAQGGEVVGRVVATMQDISDSSRRIADIIGTIDGIAFQTNILALNAAVEAARAGEQGRGFAVVAAEVRSLAQRSAEAAREIKGLIGSSVERVEAGSTLVGEAGRTMNEIVAQVKRVSDLIGEISAASVEQTQGIGQVSDAVSQLDQVTQQNAALVEQSAAAADSLRQQATQLTQAVAAFRLAGDVGVAPIGTPSARAAATAAPVKPTGATAARSADAEAWTTF
jgi:methyl-accepting chemotaxis protein